MTTKTCKNRSYRTAALLVAALIFILPSPSHAREITSPACAEGDNMLRDMAEKIQLLEKERSRLHSAAPMQSPLSIPITLEDGKKFRALETRVASLEQENAALKARLNENALSAPACAPVFAGDDGEPSADFTAQIARLEAQVKLLQSEKETLMQRLSSFQPNTASSAAPPVPPLQEQDWDSAYIPPPRPAYSPPPEPPSAPAVQGESPTEATVPIYKMRTSQPALEPQAPVVSQAAPTVAAEAGVSPSFVTAKNIAAALRQAGLDVLVLDSPLNKKSTSYRYFEWRTGNVRSTLQQYIVKDTRAALEKLGADYTHFMQGLCPEALNIRREVAEAGTHGLARYIFSCPNGMPSSSRTTFVVSGTTGTILSVSGGDPGGDPSPIEEAIIRLLRDDP